MNVWLGLLSSKLIGTVVCESSLKGGTFFLRHELPGLSKHTVFMASGHTYFHLHGAESLYTQHVKQYLQNVALTIGWVMVTLHAH